MPKDDETKHAKEALITAQAKAAVAAGELSEWQLVTDALDAVRGALDTTNNSLDLIVNELSRDRRSRKILAAAMAAFVIVFSVVGVFGDKLLRSNQADARQAQTAADTAHRALVASCIAGNGIRDELRTVVAGFAQADPSLRAQAATAEQAFADRNCSNLTTP